MKAGFTFSLKKGQNKHTKTQKSTKQSTQCSLEMESAEA